MQVTGSTPNMRLKGSRLQSWVEGDCDWIAYTGRNYRVRLASSYTGRNWTGRN